MIVNELLDPEKLELFNCENYPEKWGQDHINNAIKSITEFHLKSKNKLSNSSAVNELNPHECRELYAKLINIIIDDSDPEEDRNSAKLLIQYLSDLESQPDLEKTIIHNDFNPRNVAVRTGGDICIYDWELAIKGLPHRDVVEFLSFTLNEDFTNEELDNYLKYHFQLENQNNISWDQWKEGCVYALKEYLVTRVSFYVVGSILMKYEFAPRIFRVALKMLESLKSL